MMKFLFKVLYVALLGVATPAYANSFLIYGSGDAPDRMVVFASLNIKDRTPTDAIFGPEQIKQVNIDLVFEAPDKPEWSEMTLEFACKSEASQIQAGKKKARSDKRTLQDVPARFRVVRGSEYTRQRKYNDIAPENWAPVTSELFAQVRKFTCNELGIWDAIKAAKQGDSFDNARFVTSLSRFGLQDIVPVGAESYGGVLSDMTWAKLWTDGKRPKLEGTGRQLTAAEIAENEKKYAAFEAQMADIHKKATDFAQPQVDEMNAQAAFYKEAGRIRGNRKVSKQESSAIIAWQGKREYDVALAMGPAGISDMDGLRFLAYSNDRELIMPAVGTGPDGEPLQPIVENYRCDVRFVLAYDQNGTARVADVTIKGTRNGQISKTTVCDDFVKAPAK